MSVESQELRLITIEMPKLKKELDVFLNYLSEMEVLQLQMDKIDSTLEELSYFLPAICTPFKFHDVLLSSRRSIDGDFEICTEYIESFLINYTKVEKAMKDGDVIKNFVAGYCWHLVNKSRSCYNRVYEIQSRFSSVRNIVTSVYDTRRHTFNNLENEIEEFINYFEGMEISKKYVNSLCDLIQQNFEALRRKSCFSSGFQATLLRMKNDVQCAFANYEFYLRLLFPYSKEYKYTMKEELDNNVLYILWCLPMKTRWEYFKAMRKFREEFLKSSIHIFGAVEREKERALKVYQLTS